MWVCFRCRSSNSRLELVSRCQSSTFCSEEGTMQVWVRQCESCVLSTHSLCLHLQVFASCTKGTTECGTRQKHEDQSNAPSGSQQRLAAEKCRRRCWWPTQMRTTTAAPLTKNQSFQKSRSRQRRRRVGSVIEHCNIRLGLFGVDPHMFTSFLPAARWHTHWHSSQCSRQKKS